MIKPVVESPFSHFALLSTCCGIPKRKLVLRLYNLISEGHFFDPFHFFTYFKMFGILFMDHNMINISQSLVKLNKLSHALSVSTLHGILLYLKQVFLCISICQAQDDPQGFHIHSELPGGNLKTLLQPYFIPKQYNCRRTYSSKSRQL